MPNDPKIVFLDTEFTGEHAATTLVSIGLVTLAGDELCLAFNDYDRAQVTDWLRKNVLNQINEEETVSSPEGYRRMRMFLDDYAGNDRLFVVSAGLAQDLVLFLELFKHGREGAVQFHARHDLPEYLGHHAFIDLNTLFRAAEIAPPADRAAFAGRTEDMPAHHALGDARVVRACFLKLVQTPAGAALMKSLSS
ncbi:MAG: 3'-5' exoribonuclease [Alphaproteobacteria bacterium]|nr:3'-5' exoribonuclease [Alphaproteobacteria bacterium]